MQTNLVIGVKNRWITLAHIAKDFSDTIGNRQSAILAGLLPCRGVKFQRIRKISFVVNLAKDHFEK
ncbi:MAG: hypothetical protein ACRESR_10185, partial [Gammaproteobacteria bacterium]